jgi:hypothetical protein
LGHWYLHSQASPDHLGEAIGPPRVETAADARILFYPNDFCAKRQKGLGNILKVDDVIARNLNTG